MSEPAEINDPEEGSTFLPNSTRPGWSRASRPTPRPAKVLMVAHMNDQALRKTITTVEAWYFSRSRNSLWRKGETSGHVQWVIEMRVDCDQDAIWTASSRLAGPATPGVVPVFTET